MLTNEHAAAYKNGGEEAAKNDKNIKLRFPVPVYSSHDTGQPNIQSKFLQAKYNSRIIT